MAMAVTAVAPVTPSVPSTLVKKKVSKRLVTGYIIFASEVRKSVVQANPDCNFGDISRIIGTEWKNLPGETKTEYEKKAQKQNEETAREAAREAEVILQSPAGSLPPEHALIECHWESKCDYQFEDTQDLLEHLTGEPMGHVWRTYGESKDKEEPIFQCLFQNCGRVKKGAPPFPSIQRLIRHCKEVHVTKQNPKSVAPENRSKNFVNSTKSGRGAVPPPVSASATSTSAPPPSGAPAPVQPPISVVQTVSTGVQAKQEAMFVAPPRSHRLLHTSTYIKYVERLRPEHRHITNWENTLTATPENTTPPDRNRLPTEWLANGSGNHGNVVNALWALRNFMLQDCLGFPRLA
jgi:protein polybromo-1